VAPSFRPGAPESSEDPTDVVWTVTRDVLGRTTSCTVRHGSRYGAPYDGTASESYAGTVTVDRRTFEQSASADCTFALSWPGIEVRVRSTMTVTVRRTEYDVAIGLEAHRDGEQVASRTWRERPPR
jgi:uncharacterized protein